MIVVCTYWDGLNYTRGLLYKANSEGKLTNNHGKVSTPLYKFIKTYFRYAYKNEVKKFKER